MHRNFVTNIMVLCALTLAVNAQEAGTAAAPPRHARNDSQATTKASSSPVGMDQPVITLKGACQPIGSLQPAKECVSAVTREQFEKITNALQPNMPADTKRNFAINYGRLLVFSDAALALHLENDPNVQLLLQFVTKQVLADGVRRRFSDEFAHPTDQQIQAYYDQNKVKYQEATLLRIVIPRNSGSEDKPQPSEAEWKAAAEKLRERWVAGEDPVKLQEAAFAAAGVTGAGTPEISLGARRQGSLPAGQDSVFQLKPGDVSPVFFDPAAAYIYKVVSARQVPLTEERESISQTLQKQMLQEKLEEINKSATPELNEQYFGPPPGGASPGMPAGPGSAPAPQATHPPK
jgi:parvulin-like peptidyl-prolyl cis-trans isomerase-like protein